MITENELKDFGYKVLSRGGWLRIDANMMPWEWSDVCRDFDVDPNCTEIILAIAGVKEVFKETTE